jgi:hypothetical protein
VTSDVPVTAYRAIVSGRIVAVGGDQNQIAVTVVVTEEVNWIPRVSWEWSAVTACRRGGCPNSVTAASSAPAR